MVTSRHHSVHQQVEQLYTSSSLPSAHWMWEHHLQFVAQKAEEIAAQVQASIEKVVSAAFLHDVADAQMKRNNPQHEAESEKMAREILHNATFTDEEIEEIVVQLLSTHSGYAENPPQTLDAKVLATADALGHLNTNFYDVINREGLKKLFDNDMTEDQYQAWFLEKIDRDFYNKIFFEEIREEVQPRYEELKTRFHT